MSEEDQGMVYRVVFATRAIQDLGDIVRFQAKLNAPYAERLGNALFDAAMSLATLPRRGVAVPERAGYRRIFHPRWYLIFYTVNDTTQSVSIVRIWNARKDPDLLWPA
jgi:plasmid stabilization system protein ParE